MNIEAIDGAAFGKRGIFCKMAFDGIEDQTVTAVASYSKYRTNYESDIRYDDAAFVGRDFASWKAVYDAVVSPWEEGLGIVDSILAELEGSLPKPKEIRRRGRWSEEGGEEVSVDRYRAGEPFFYEIAPRPVSGPRLVTLVVQIGGNCHLASRDLLMRGAVAVALSRILEDAGYRTEIVGVSAALRAYQNGDGLICVTSIKKASDPLDVVALTNAFSGWYFRTVYFATMHANGLRIGWGRGSSFNIDQKVAEYVATGAARPWLVSGFYSIEGAVAVAKALLEQLEKGLDDVC
jgi:hypothetical protein